MRRRSTASPPSTARRRRRACTAPPSIKVAEAAKVLENTQRDLNIALMNELALICDRLGIRTADVLEAARHEVELPAVHAGPGRRTLHRRRSLLPDLEGARRSAITRRSSSPDAASTTLWAAIIAQRLVKLMLDQRDKRCEGRRVGILGLTFKENVPGPAQQPGPRHHRRAEVLRGGGAGARSAGGQGRSRAGI